MRILVTGGAGFIGSHTAKRLISDGHDVSIVDDLNDFYSPALKRANLADVAQQGAFRFYECDICDEGRVLEIADEVRPEAVVHLAARAGVRPSISQPSLYERVNVGGTLNLLEASARVKVRRFILASSSSIYGVTSRVPFSEDDDRNLPVSPYAATKLAAEKLAHVYSHLYGLEVVCLRLFTVYGPRQRPDLAIRKFTEMIQKGKPLPFFGDGSSGRDYTYVDDIVDGIAAAVAYQCRYEIFNLGNSQPVALSGVVSRIEAALGLKARLNHLPDQLGDVPITYADIGKARRLLGYSPQVTFSVGIERFVKWFLAHYPA